MVFCPTCGAENSDPGNYCKYCGSEIELPPAAAARLTAHPVAPSPPAASRPAPVAAKGIPKKKTKKIGIVVLVLFTIAASSYGILVAATWGTYDQTVPFSCYASGEDWDNITINVGMSTGDINVAYVDPVNGSPLVQGAYEQHLTGSKFGEYEFTASHSGKNVNLAQNDIPWIFHCFGYSRANLQLLKNTSYILMMGSGTGNINVTIPSGTKELKSITITASTGNVLLVGTDVNVTNDVRAEASTGDVKVTFTNVNVTGSLTTSTSTGKLAVTLARCTVSGNTNCHASTGDVEVAFTDTHAEGNFEFSTSTGHLTLMFVNLTIDNDAPSFRADCSTGDLRVEFQQRVELGGTMGTDLKTSTGNIELYYKGLPSLATGFKGAGTTSTGNVEVHTETETGFSTGTGNSVIETTNYGSATSKINALNIETSTGNIDLYATSLS